MSKDPATLWYWNDWLTGTMTFTRHQKGCYMDLLGAQFNSGHLSLDEIKNVLGNDFAMWGVLSKKFIQDPNGLWFNVKAEETVNKRRSFTASRKMNATGHMPTHMENEIENRKLKFITEVVSFKGDFSENLILVFVDYWLEMNKSKTKFRFEDQKYFDVKKRLATFQRNESKYGNNKDVSKLEGTIMAYNQVLKNIENGTC